MFVPNSKAPGPFFLFETSACHRPWSGILISCPVIPMTSPMSCSPHLLVRRTRLLSYVPALLALAALLAAPCLLSQSVPVSKAQTAPAVPLTSPDISKEGLVLEKVYTQIRMEADGIGTRRSIARIHVLADSGVKEMAVLTFTYTASNQQVDIDYVRVIKPDGTVVVTPGYNTQDMPADVTRSAPMYSDIHQKHVAVKGLGVGDTLEYQVTLNTLKPEVPGQFWFEYTFQKDLIVLDEQVDLDMPADKPVTVASSPADAQPAVNTVAGRKRYHWASSNLARPDPDAPPKSVKHLNPSIQVTTFSNWEQVGAWYKSLQRDSLAITPAIQAKVAVLTKGLVSNADKTRAIFNDVALHTHYVGLDFGIGRYQPHLADDVLSNEYGDCKDKHTLLATELKAAGIEAWPVLISSSRELDPATPSPAQFDHVITVVPFEGKLLWMDSTAEVAPIGVILATLRDKQALVIPDAKPAYLERTPANLPFSQSAHFQIEGKLSDQGVFTGHIVQSYRGDVELFMRAILRAVPQSQWKEFMQRVSNSTGFAGEVSNPQVSEIETTSKPLEFSYDYVREKFGEWDTHRVSAPLPAFGWELGPGVKEKKPADEPELGSPGEVVYSSTIQLPQGWSAYLPKQVDLFEDWAEYHSIYSVTQGTLTAKRRVVVKMSKVPLDQWDAYIAFRRAIFNDENTMTPVFDGVGSQGFPRGVARFLNQADSEMSATLELLGSASAILGAEKSASQPELNRALDLAQKAVSAVEAKTLTLSIEDPRSLYWMQILSSAWTTLGRASLRCNDLATAESYLRASWQLSQDRMSGYQLGRLREAQGQRTTAAHFYELASVISGGDSLSERIYSDAGLLDQIKESYRTLTGKPLTATALNNGQYNGSLRAELDKETELRGFVHESKLNGQALFTISSELDKPVKAHFLQGDKVMEQMAGTVELRRKLPVVFPGGSKARLLREIRLVCTPYAGCDAYVLLPHSIQIPE